MEVKGELRSVSLGPHPFEQRCNSTDPLALYKESQFMSTDEFKDHPKRLNGMYHRFEQHTDLSRCRITGEPIPHRNWAALFNGLRSLRLPLFFEESLPPLSEGVGQELCRLFNAIPDTIANLALVAKGPIDGFLQHQDTPASLQSLEPFNLLVTKLHLPHLRSLELEGWVTDYATLYRFLDAHASTLRSLHLIDIYACGNPYLWKDDEYGMGEADEEEDMYPFGEFVRSNLHLTGIEIHHFEHQRYPAGTSEGLDQHSWLVDPLETTPGDWDEDRDVMEDRLFDDDDDSKASILDSPRLERLCLGGRPNLIHRRVRPGTSRAKAGEDDAMAEENVRPKQWRGPGYYWTRRPAYR
jgi:hypothetical protein